MKKFKLYTFPDLMRISVKYRATQARLRKNADYLVVKPNEWSVRRFVRIDCVGFHPCATWVSKRRRLWVYEPKQNTVTLGDPSTGGWVYQVDLDRCGTASSILDWLGQISGKTWATQKDLGGLVRILDAVFDGLQKTFVYGTDKCGT